MNNTIAVSLIKREESFRAFVYDDATSLPLGPGDTIKGHPTVGYGLCLDVAGIDEDDAQVLTARRVNAIDKGLREAHPECYPKLSSIRQAVLISMAYQMGLAGVNGFQNMWLAIGAANWRSAYDSMLDSLWARQTPKRAARAARAMVEDRLSEF